MLCIAEKACECSSGIFCHHALVLVLPNRHPVEQGFSGRHPMFDAAGHARHSLSWLVPQGRKALLGMQAMLTSSRDLWSVQVTMRCGPLMPFHVAMSRTLHIRLRF